VVYIVLEAHMSVLLGMRWCLSVSSVSSVSSGVRCYLSLACYDKIMEDTQM